MKAALGLIVMATLGGIGYGLYLRLSHSNDWYGTLIQLDTTIRIRFWRLVSEWPLFAWAVVVGTLEGVDYRSRNLFGGYQRGLMRLSVPLFAAGVGVGAVSLAWVSMPGLGWQLVMVGIVGLASFAVVAGRPLLR